jgi:hypothetical protein
MVTKARRLVMVAAAAALFSGRPSLEAVAQHPRPPLAPLTSRALPDGSTRFSVELEATSIDLSHLGQHTHANWVVFELPFDTTRRDLRNVRFRPRALVGTDVAALHTPILCLPAPTLGPVEDARWSKLTLGGIGQTDLLGSRALAPTNDARAYAINVPTRVANAAACGEPVLASKESWRLEVTWDGPGDHFAR